MSNEYLEKLEKNEDQEATYKSGYTASRILCCSILVPSKKFTDAFERKKNERFLFIHTMSDISLGGKMCVYSPQIHHAHAANATGARTYIIRTKQAMKAAISSGAIQYPSTQRP